MFATPVATLPDGRIDTYEHILRLERRHHALKRLRALFAPGDDIGLLQVATAMGHGHSVGHIINQFGEKLVSAFLKEDLESAWDCYGRLRPTTVGEEMAALLNRTQFEEMHQNLHLQLALTAYAMEQDCRQRIEGKFVRADANQFSGPGPGSLEALRREGLSVSLDPWHVADVAEAAHRLTQTPLPVSEMLKDERIVAVSGLSGSKMSLVVHDLIDHLWTMDLLDQRGVLSDYSELLRSIGDPHLRDIRSREGEVMASIAFGVRFFNTVEPGFSPIVSACRLRRIMERRVTPESPARHHRALEIIQQATTDERRGFKYDRRSLESQSLAFVFSNYVTELNEQRRKHGKIKQRLADGTVRELPTFDTDFLSFFIECHHQLTRPKNQHLNMLGRAQLMIEEWLLDVVDARIPPPFELTITLDGLRAYRPEITRVHSARAKWILDHYGFAASPIDQR